MSSFLQFFTTVELILNYILLYVYVIEYCHVSQVIACGQMYKKGSHTHKYIWKMKWFVLTATELEYYESKAMSVRKVCVCIRLNCIVS